MPNTSNRLELARKLHDGLAQDLAALGYQLDNLIGSADTSAIIKHDLRHIRLALISIINDFRDDIYLLRTLNFQDLETELTELLSRIESEINLPIGLFSLPTENALSRAILEIARNSLKHSDCTKFTVNYRTKNSQQVSLVISDDGCGKIEVKAGSFGLLTIAEELGKIGATFEQIKDFSGNHYFIEVFCK